MRCGAVGNVFVDFKHCAVPIFPGHGVGVDRIAEQRRIGRRTGNRGGYGIPGIIAVGILRIIFRFCRFGTGINRRIAVCNGVRGKHGAVPIFPGDGVGIDRCITNSDCRVVCDIRHSIGDRAAVFDRCANRAVGRCHSRCYTVGIGFAEFNGKGYAAAVIDRCCRRSRHVVAAVSRGTEGDVIGVDRKRQTNIHVVVNQRTGQCIRRADKVIAGCRFRRDSILRKRKMCFTERSRIAADGFTVKRKIERAAVTVDHNGHQRGLLDPAGIQHGRVEIGESCGRAVCVDDFETCAVDCVVITVKDITRSCGNSNRRHRFADGHCHTVVAACALLLIESIGLGQRSRDGCVGLCNFLLISTVAAGSTFRAARTSRNITDAGTPAGRAVGTVVAVRTAFAAIAA